MKRRTTEEERKLFKAHIDEPRALKAAEAKKSLKPGRAPPPPLREAHDGGGGRSTLSSVRRPEGVKELDNHTAGKLKRGELRPAARIDLHGMTEAAAHAALLSFLAGAQARGARLALVVTGVGNPAPHQGAAWLKPPHGVLKEMVPRWLKEKEFAALAMGTAPAHRRHGGHGALYVYLRKPG